MLGRRHTGCSFRGMLEASLILLLGTWVLAFVRVAKTWRDTPPVTLADAPTATVHRLAA